MDGATRTRFHIGQVIRHRRFGYRGVIANVDARPGSTEQAPAATGSHAVGRSLLRYYVLVDGEDFATFVTEPQLERDESGKPVEHPHLSQFFAAFRHGSYVTRARPN